MTEKYCDMVQKKKNSVKKAWRNRFEKKNYQKSLEVLQIKNK